MINKVILYGTVGHAPEIFMTQDGREIATVSLATSQHWKDKTGECQSVTDWHRVTIFRESTVRWIKYSLRRGDKVYVEGKLTYQHWTDKQGKERRTAHVVISGADKFERLNRPQSSLQHNELASEKNQASVSSLMENEGICPSLDFPEDQFSIQPSHHKGETTYEK